MQSIFFRSSPSFFSIKYRRVPARNQPKLVRLFGTGTQGGILIFQLEIHTIIELV